MNNLHSFYPSVICCTLDTFLNYILHTLFGVRILWKTGFGWEERVKKLWVGLRIYPADEGVQGQQELFQFIGYFSCPMSAARIKFASLRYSGADAFKIQVTLGLPIFFSWQAQWSKPEVPGNTAGAYLWKGFRLVVSWILRTVSPIFVPRKQTWHTEVIYLTICSFAVSVMPGGGIEYFHVRIPYREVKCSHFYLLHFVNNPKWLK